MIAQNSQLLTDAQDRAMQRGRDILTTGNSAAFSPDVEAEIRATFGGLVTGNSRPPASWSLPARRPRRPGFLVPSRLSPDRSPPHRRRSPALAHTFSTR
jgi:hypothetical protein